LSERFPSNRFYNKLQNKWWDHYEVGQPALIDDLELETGKCLMTYLKLWTDIYGFKVEYKGGAKDIRPPLIVITSNYHPWDIMGENVSGWYEPMIRRLEVIYIGKTPSELPPPKGPAELILPEPPRSDLVPATAGSVPVTSTNTTIVDLTETA